MTERDAIDRPAAMPSPDEEAARLEAKRCVRAVSRAVGVVPPAREGDEPSRPPWFGGVRHDPATGRIVLAVTSTADVDVDAVTAAAAPFDLDILAVPVGHDELRALRHVVLDRCLARGVHADALLEWTPDGPIIRLVTSTSEAELPPFDDLTAQVVDVVTDASPGSPRNATPPRQRGTMS